MKALRDDLDAIRVTLAELDGPTRDGIRGALAAPCFPGDAPFTIGAGVDLRDHEGGARCVVVRGEWLPVHAVRYVLDPPVTFVAVYDHAWGTGPTPQEAKAAARRMGRAKGRHAIVRAPNGAYDVRVTCQDGVRWRWGLDADTAAAAIVVKVAGDLVLVKIGGAL